MEAQKQTKEVKHDSKPTGNEKNMAVVLVRGLVRVGHNVKDTRSRGKIIRIAARRLTL